MDSVARDPYGHGSRPRGKQVFWTKYQNCPFRYKY